MKMLSICIPTYEMNGLGDVFLRQSFDVLADQTFKDFDIVVSDHSTNDIIQNLCREYAEVLSIAYYRNTEHRGSSSANINNAISKATGKLIKILFQDDFLFHENALKDIVDNFDLEKDGWMATASQHTKDGIHFFKPFYPSYNDKIYLGKNTISSPSVITIRNKSPLLFDENLIWLMDCDYYSRCFREYGEPKILNKINVVNRIGSHQVTASLVNIFTKLKERRYMINKNKTYDHN